MDISPGARLALLLADGFDLLVDDVVRHLQQQGHPGVTATLEFALTAIDEGADTASALGRRLGVSKQAAAKTIAALEQLDYVARADDPDDARRKRLAVSDRGYEMIAIGAARFDELRSRWAASLGPGGIERLEDALVRCIGREPRSIPAQPAS